MSGPAASTAGDMVGSAVADVPAGTAECAVADTAQCAVPDTVADAAECAVADTVADAAGCAVADTVADAAECAVAGTVADAAGCAVAEAFRRRAAPGAALAGAAGVLAAVSHAMARRFHRGGRLLAFGAGAAATDAQHIAVEFLHPVVAGRRVLPAFSLTGDAATLTGIGSGPGSDDVFAHQIRCLGAPDDIAFGISPDGRCGSVLHGLRAARDRGMLTVALAGGDGGALTGAADHLVTVPSTDPRVVKEVHVTAYHLLWELVHVFLEQPDVLGQEVVA